jgi:hypothetical protein
VPFRHGRDELIAHYEHFGARFRPAHSFEVQRRARQVKEVSAYQTLNITGFLGVLSASVVSLRISLETELDLQIHCRPRLTWRLSPASRSSRETPAMGHLILCERSVV